MKQKLRVSSPLPWISKRNVPAGCFLAAASRRKRELRYHVLPSHVGSVDIVRAENEHALEIFAAEIDRHHFADQLAGAIGVTRVQRVGHHQRRALVGRHFGRRLIDLGARRENSVADAVLAAGVDHIDHAAHADIEHQVGLAVEKFRAVDEGEVMHLVHPLRGLGRPRRVANIAGDELDVLFTSLSRRGLPRELSSSTRT